MIKSQFNYYPLLSPFYSRQSNNSIIKVHKRALRVICNDQQSSFQQSSYCSLKITSLMLTKETIELCKIINQMVPPIKHLLFAFCENMHKVRNYHPLNAGFF